MKTATKLIFVLAAGATLATAAPAFADPRHDRGYDHGYRGERYYDRRDHRDYRDYRVHERRHVVVVERPYVVQRAYVVEQPVYYGAPAMGPNIGTAAMIGAAIGGYIDNQR